MSEIRLNTTGGLPPVVGTAAIAPAGPMQLTTAVVPPSPDAPAISLGGALATLNDGDRLEGVVSGEDASGLPILRTTNGSYSLSSTQPVAQNTHLVLQIVNGGNPIQALILSENGTPLQPPSAVQLHLISPDGQDVVAVDALPDMLAAFEETVLARRLIGTALSGLSAGAPGQARPLPVGSIVVLQVTGVSSGPASATLSSPPHLVASTASSANVTAPTVKVAAPTVAVSDPAAEVPPPAVAPTSISFTQAAPTTPPTEPAANPVATGGRATGVVVMAPVAGQMLLRTSLGVLSVSNDVPLPVGTSLTFDIISVKAPARQPASAAAFGDPLSRLSHEWPALSEILSVLQTPAPNSGEGIPAAAIPQLTDRLASGLLFFFAALRGGNVASWLGTDAFARVSARGRGDLLRRLSEDFTDLSRLAKQTSPSDWRAVPLPLFDGQRILQIMLYARHHRQRGENGEDKDLGTRFVLDVEFAITGPMQFDGLVQSKQFDLIVRSHAALTNDIRLGIAEIFDDGLAVAGHRGLLTFQVGQRFLPIPAQELRRSRDPVAIVV